MGLNFALWTPEPARQDTQRFGEDKDAISKPHGSGRQSAQTCRITERAHVRCYSFERGSKASVFNLCPPQFFEGFTERASVTLNFIEPPVSIG